MFMFVMWLQGIWLPLHGFSFSSTPLWAGIYMLPMTGGFLLAGPISSGLTVAFTFGAIACALAALASVMRGGRYVHSVAGTPEASSAPAEGPARGEATTSPAVALTDGERLWPLVARDAPLHEAADRCRAESS